VLCMVSFHIFNGESKRVFVGFHFIFYMESLSAVYGFILYC